MFPNEYTSGSATAHGLSAAAVEHWNTMGDSRYCTVMLGCRAARCLDWLESSMQSDLCVRSLYCPTAGGTSTAIFGRLTLDERPIVYRLKTRVLWPCRSLIHDARL